jgi:hypothetical protein
MPNYYVVLVPRAFPILGSPPPPNVPIAMKYVKADTQLANFFAHWDTKVTAGGYDAAMEGATQRAKELLEKNSFSMLLPSKESYTPIKDSSGAQIGHRVDGPLLLLGGGPVTIRYPQKTGPLYSIAIGFELIAD